MNASTWYIGSQTRLKAEEPQVHLGRSVDGCAHLGCFALLWRAEVSTSHTWSTCAWGQPLYGQPRRRLAAYRQVMMQRRETIDVRVVPLR